MAEREFLQSLMGRSVRVTLSDDRVVEGTLDCVDNQGNLIVNSVTISLSETKPMKLGSVMVPGEHIAKLEVASAPENPEQGHRDQQ